jgi:hypothetical protein
MGRGTEVLASQIGGDGVQPGSERTAGLIGALFQQAHERILHEVARQRPIGSAEAIQVGE